MIAVRKEIEVFADFNNRELIDVDNPHLFVFERYSLSKQAKHILVVANFDGKPQDLDLGAVGSWASNPHGKLLDLYSGITPDIFNKTLVVPGFGFYWLSEIL